MLLYMKVVIKVLGVEVEDNNNSILEPDETANFDINVANVGGLNAFGFVSGDLSGQ